MAKVGSRKQPPRRMSSEKVRRREVNSTSIIREPKWAVNGE